MESPAKRILSVDTMHFEFVRVPLLFKEGCTSTDVFAHKNNKTLGQTLNHPKYAGVASIILPNYTAFLSMPVGNFLIGLKRKGDMNYRLFLNSNGDLTYSTFALADETCLNDRGIYAYFVGTDVKYIGRCRDTMKKRVNQGYGKIHPKNCFIDGQATNCRLNALITTSREDISLWLCSIASDEKIITTEAILLRKHNPPWNIQRP